MNISTHTPFVLVILDGWGYRTEEKYNAIVSANTPCWDKLWQKYPHMLISGSGNGVGLPEGQMGNSEVGHLNIGAGRIVYQEFSRVEHAIEIGEFYSNPTLVNAVQTAVKNNKAVHILGLLSPGGVHSHERQIMALVDLAAQQHCDKVFVHAFLDGRDTPPKSALNSLRALESQMKQLKCGRIASIIGRYYAMDRDKRWDRTQKAYDLLTLGKADFVADSAPAALAAAYERNETDEFVLPTIIEKPALIEDGDVVVFMNFRADRARQLSRAFVEENFNGFERYKKFNLGAFVTLTQYAEDIPATVVYLPQVLSNVLGEYVANLGWRQLRIAETEKYAHVTFFFNGGVETPFPNEERMLIPSPPVATYDLKPEMSAPELTERLVSAIQSKNYQMIICNFANPDMVGHTGNFTATRQAIECIDLCLGRIVHAIQQVGGQVMITADHGNAECMYDESTQQPHTAHTSDPVPLIYVGRDAVACVDDGKLSDIAPTLLYLLDVPVPTEMTGRPLFRLNE